MPVRTLIGLTNSPSLIQTVPRLQPLSPAGLLVGRLPLLPTGRVVGLEAAPLLPRPRWSEFANSARASGATISGCGVHRSAALGTVSTSSRRLTSNFTLAVRYGSNLALELSVITSTVYVTTFCVIAA